MDKAKKLTEKLLKQIEIDGSAKVEEKDGILYVTIVSDDSGLLIGRHGENLQSIQLILGMMLNRGRQEWKRVVVDVGDYRNQRNEILSKMAQRAANRARDLGEEQELPAMSPFERRIIHTTISEEKGVSSESRGTGADRRVIVKPEK